MSQRDKIRQKLEDLVTNLFNMEHKKSKICSISASFIIHYNIRGKSKFMQNSICTIDNPINSRLSNMPILIDKSLVGEVSDCDRLVVLQDLDKTKIKKKFSMAVIDPKTIDKTYKNILVRKFILDSKIESKEEILNTYNNLLQNKVTKLIQTNNTISGKIGDLSQGVDIIKQNLCKVVEFLNSRNIIIKHTSLLLHNNCKIKAMLTKIA